MQCGVSETPLNTKSLFAGFKQALIICTCSEFWFVHNFEKDGVIDSLESLVLYSTRLGNSLRCWVLGDSH